MFPGVLVVQRSAEEEAANPDRLNLSGRGLDVRSRPSPQLCCAAGAANPRARQRFPMVERGGELRLLNLQSNAIGQLERLSGFTQLVFLDMYDNRLEGISGLQVLPSLRVLMLGKNRIARIENLGCLALLDVLDLHSNQISRIEGLEGLRSLRVLNLAGNAIEVVEGLGSLVSLSELNLRRNAIVRVDGSLGTLPGLERLFLNQNRLGEDADAEPLAGSRSLVELALSENPLTSMPRYREIWIDRVRSLRVFDGRRVAEDERHMAGIMLRKEKNKLADAKREAAAQAERERAIHEAQACWRAAAAALERGEPPLRRTSSHGSIADEAQPGTFFEVEGETLVMYGPGFAGLDASFYGAITAIRVHFVTLADLLPHLSKMRSRFPSVVRLSLVDTHVGSLRQLGALAALKRLHELVIRETVPGVTAGRVWRAFLVHRFANTALAAINGEAITPAEAERATDAFKPLDAWRAMGMCPQQHHVAVDGAIGSGRPSTAASPRRPSTSSGRRGSDRDAEAGRRDRRASGRETRRFAPALRFARSWVAHLAEQAQAAEAQRLKLNAEWDDIVLRVLREAVAEMIQ